MRTQRKTSVLLVDAEPVMRCGLLHLINSHGGLHVCAEAATLPAARAACEKWKPDVVVLDVAMGGGEGFALVKELPRWNPKVAVVAFTALEDAASVQRALRAGVCGYVSRRDPAVALVVAILGALAGDRHVGPRVEHVLLESLAISRVSMAADELAGLSERERQVFALLGRGLKAGAVAVEMRLSVKTVETHQKHIREKLRLRDGAEVQRRATIFHMGQAGMAQEDGGGIAAR